MAGEGFGAGEDEYISAGAMHALRAVSLKKDGVARGVHVPRLREAADRDWSFIWTKQCSSKEFEPFCKWGEECIHELFLARR